MALIRCADIACAEPKRTVLGKVKGGVAQSMFSHKDQTVVQFRETRAVFSIEYAVYEATPEGKLGPGKYVGKPVVEFEHPLALNVSPQGRTAVVNYPAGPPPGLRISIGKPLGMRHQTVVFLLPDALSERTQKIPLRLTDHAPQRVLIATNPDGRVFLVEQGRQTFAITLTPDHQPR